MGGRSARLNAREREQHPQDTGKGHTVVKFSPEGKVLMTIGKRGVAGNPPDALTEPTGVVVAPNGDVFISGGTFGAAPTRAAGHRRPDFEVHPRRQVHQVFRPARDRARSEFRTPHDIAMDAQGRLFVADRGNMRLQILDQNGTFIAEWKQFGRPSGVEIRNDMIYVADSESNGVAPHPGWKRGIRIGSVKDGKVLYRIPDPLEMKGTSAAEGVAVDAKGNVYGGEVGPRQLVKHVK